MQHMPDVVCHCTSRLTKAPDQPVRNAVGDRTVNRVLGVHAHPPRPMECLATERRQPERTPRTGADMQWIKIANVRPIKADVMANTTVNISQSQNAI